MQIVRDLAGYTLGRSDLVRRAMSKKKTKVMEEERKNFVYGNEEQGVKGCIANGISEQTANKIYDEMIDFAKYAFNKSHAAAYAVVAYQTAYLKYYDPVEFMAALMTSVKDNTTKVSEYIQTCRSMNIAILPPDINEGEGDFSVSEGAIRYGMNAIKSIGAPVVRAIVEERGRGGPYRGLKDFIDRIGGREVNKRAVENLIKSGAADCLEGNRRQKTLIYPMIMDQAAQERKSSIEGQMSLFDLAPAALRQDFEIRMPDVPEFGKEELLSFEKEVLGVYVSGHPLEEYEEKWRKNITAVSTDFIYDEESGEAKLPDGAHVMIGGMITDKTVKFTKNNKTMAFLTMEDLYGTTEVIVFPRDYEKYRELIADDAKLFISGRVSAEEEKNGKLICERIYAFSDAKKELWLQFPTKEAYADAQEQMYDLLRSSEGGDSVVIYISGVKAVKRLPANWNVSVDALDFVQFYRLFGEKNVKVVEKAIENDTKRD